MPERTFRVATVLLAMLALRATSGAAAPCDDVAGLVLPHATVTSALLVPAGGFTPPSGAGRERTPFARLPAFCRVMVTSKPSADSDIRIEVWLPVTGWNGRFETVGQGGLAGSIPYQELAEGVGEQYATAGTDTGHVGGNADFMPAHPEKLTDLAYRAIHEVAEVGKAIVTRYYGRAANHSYFNGCSGGGRHGLTSAQRYPQDFDGIVAGASSWNQARLDAARIGVNLTVNRTPAHQIPPAKYPMIHEAVLQACDALDGTKDGVLENPTACRFDYAALTCHGPDGPDCLTPAQVESAQVLTSAFKNPDTGTVLFEAHLWPGAELEWATLGGPEPLANSLARVRNFHLKDSNWQFRLSTIAADIERATAMDNGLMASREFNLKLFFDHGGKLLMYHGWSDPQVPAQNSIIYFQNVMKAVGERAADSIELFMIPGMLHCSGGPGTDTFDKMDAITRWVEQGTKPARIAASHAANGRIDKTRPLCPFGKIARYKGSGSTTDAASFSCVAEPIDTSRR